MDIKSDKVTNKVMAGILIMLFGFAFYIGWLVIFPINVLQSGNVRIEPKTVEPGGTISYIVDYCKRVNQTAEVSIYLFNQKIVPLPPVTSSRPAGCRKNVARPVIIPKDTAPGTHHLEIDIHYQFNPLHSATYHLITPNFEVTAP